MDLRKKVKKGFTLIELMVVIVIIGILVAIALPNFISAQDRAKVASVKSNMHTIQTMIETYAVDWGGTYSGQLGSPTSTDDSLMKEAKAKSYAKDFKNPFTAASGPDASYMSAKTAGAIVATGTTAGTGLTNLNAGAVSYDPITTAGTITKYFIYGGDKTANQAILDKGQAFYLTNQ